MLRFLFKPAAWKRFMVTVKIDTDIYGFRMVLTSEQFSAVSELAKHFNQISRRYQITVQ